MVIIFCGVPGTGKSTIAKGLIPELKKLGKTKFLISDEIHQRRYKHIYQWIEKNLKVADYLVIDATFYKKEWREKVKEIAGGKNVFTIYLHCSLTTCLERNKKRISSFPERVIHIINAEMEKPEKPDISIDTDKIEPKEALAQILNEIKRRQKWQ